MDTAYWLLNSHLHSLRYLLTVLLIYITGFNHVHCQLGSGDQKVVNGQESQIPQEFHMSLQLPELDQIYEDSDHIAWFNCSFTHHGEDKDITVNNVTTIPHIVYAILKTRETRVVVPYISAETQANYTYKDSTLTFTVDCIQPTHTFLIHSKTVGRSVLRMQISRTPTWTESPLYHSDLDVSVIRQVRMPDLAFDCATPVIMLLVTFSVGCVTDLQQMKTLRNQPIPILTGLISQFFLMPLLSLCVAKICFREPDMGLGLLLVAVLPGGGGGHLMVAILQAELSLSYVLNFTAYAISLVTAPLWVLSMGRFVKSDHTYIPYGKLMLWLSCAFACYVLGLCLRRKSAKVADAILNWLTKPFLLFASILFVSLGLYINFFMFLVLDIPSLIGMALYPCLAYTLGYFLPCAIRQEQRLVKCIAIESAIPNCILALVVVQYTLPQPASDICTIAPIFVLLFSPAPFILEYLFKQLQVLYTDKCAKNQDIKSSTFNIAASNSLLNVTHMTHLPESSSILSQRHDGSSIDETPLASKRNSHKVTTL